MPDDPAESTTQETIQKLLVATIGLLDTFNADQRSQALYGFDDRRRLDWDIIPKPDRTGVPLHVLDRHQKVTVFDIVRLAISWRGFTKVLAITQLEHLLRELEHGFLGIAAPLWRTADSYFLSIFGRPGFEDSWTLRFLGHHVCLNITIVNQRWISVTPSALGQQPALDSGVLAPLAEDEGLGFELLRSLDATQLRQAVIHDVAPADFVTRQVPRIGSIEYPDHYDLGMPQYQIGAHDRSALALRRDEPSGIPASSLDAEQNELLNRLIDVFLHRCPDSIASAYRTEIAAGGAGSVHFAWAGGLEPATPHYFRVHTQHLLIELVNSVNGGDHIHSVLRDFRDDLGHDSLRAYAAEVAQHGYHLASRTESSEATGLAAATWVPPTVEGLKPHETSGTA
jgi:Protein of unknown function (DUF3500)